MALTNLFDTGLSSPAELPPSVFAGVSSRLVDALSSASSAPIAALEQSLSAAIRQLLTRSSPQVIQAIKGSRDHRTELEAYALGQLSFAQQLSAYVVNSRIDDSYVRELSDKKWAPYLRELLLGERTNTELALSTQQAEETVSRKVKDLRALGITDYRKEGVYVINFLTPVARRILVAQKESHGLSLDREYASARGSVENMLLRVKNDTPEYMRNPQTFAHTKTVVQPHG